MALSPLLLALLFAQVERPDVARRGGDLVMRLPADLLEERSVEAQLATALTTTFLIEVQREGDSLGVAELQVRYDLWDEEYVVSRRGFSESLESERLASREELVKWWTASMPMPAEVRMGDVVEFDLLVLPFTLAEEDDAREWLARSGGLSNRQQGRGIIEALIGTTLRARPLARHGWKVRLVEAER